MPRLATTVTATTTTEVKLSPKVRKALLTDLKTYATLKTQRDAIDAAMRKHRGNIENVMNEVGEDSLSVDGFKTKLVAPIKRKFNPKKFVQNGGDMAIYNKSVDEVPTTPYVKVTVPGAQDEEDE